MSCTSFIKFIPILSDTIINRIISEFYFHIVHCQGKEKQLIFILTLYPTTLNSCISFTGFVYVHACMNSLEFSMYKMASSVRNFTSFTNLDVFYFLFLSQMLLKYQHNIFDLSFTWLPVPDSLLRESPALGPPPDKLVLKDASTSPLKAKSSLRPGGYQHHHQQGPIPHPKLRTLGFYTHLVTNLILTTFLKIPEYSKSSTHKPSSCKLSKRHASPCISGVLFKVLYYKTEMFYFLPLYSRCTFQGTLRLKCFTFCACMYYLCEKYYKPIQYSNILAQYRATYSTILYSILVQHYIADCVSWVPRLTLLDLLTNETYKRALRTELIRK